MKKTFIHIRISTKNKEAIKQIAKSKEETMSKIIVDTLISYLLTPSHEDNPNVPRGG